VSKFISLFTRYASVKPHCRSPLKICYSLLFLKENSLVDDQLAIYFQPKTVQKSIELKIETDLSCANHQIRNTGLTVKKTI